MPSLASDFRVRRSFGTIYRLRARQGRFFAFALTAVRHARRLSLLFFFFFLTDMLEGCWKPWGSRPYRAGTQLELLRCLRSPGNKEAIYFFLWSWTTKREGFVSYRKTAKT